MIIARRDREAEAACACPVEPDRANEFEPDQDFAELDDAPQNASDGVPCRSETASDNPPAGTPSRRGWASARSIWRGSVDAPRCGG